ncbi:esterase-like activity of phytase family protein, partial [Streptomyces sp. SID11233]|nr:esterase-like activity of phytase family protein [Streptomyces sp. SID11233]
TYTPDRQYGYMASDGLGLVDLAAVNSHQLLALERQYTAGLGNAIKVVEIELRGAGDVTEKESLFRLPPESFAEATTLLDLAACPAG